MIGNQSLQLGTALPVGKVMTVAATQPQLFLTVGAVGKIAAAITAKRFQFCAKCLEAYGKKQCQAGNLCASLFEHGYQERGKISCGKCTVDRLWRKICRVTACHGCGCRVNSPMSGNRLPLLELASLCRPGIAIRRVGRPQHVQESIISLA